MQIMSNKCLLIMREITKYMVFSSSCVNKLYDRQKLSNSFTIKNSFLKLTAIKSKTLKFGMFFAISIQRRYNATGNYNA